MEAGENPSWGDLFPAGPYWETGAATRRADWVLRGPFPGNAAPGRLKFRRILHVPPGLSGKQVVACCALGDNSSFVESLSLLGLTCVKLFTKKNHQPFSRNEIEKIRKKHPHLPILTTEKDAVKIPGILDVPGVTVVPQRVNFSPELIRELFLKLKFGTFYDAMTQQERKGWPEPVSF